MVTFRQLRYFDALTRTKHFGMAADHCAVTQPALSMQIKELEDELKVSLVERRKSGVELTEQGEEIARRARNILASVRGDQYVLAGPRTTSQHCTSCHSMPMCGDGRH